MGTEGPVVGRAPLGLVEFGMGGDGLGAVGAGFWDRGPVVGVVVGRVGLSSGSAIKGLAPLGLEERKGERIRAPEVLSRAGDRERERECVWGRPDRRDCGSSAAWHSVSR